jgi:hypothetical protein
MTVLKRIRGAIGMALTWAAGWAGAGVLIGVSSNLFPGLPWDRFFEVFDAPLVMLALPGFLGGLIFSVVLGVAAREKTFDELSVPRFAALGAIGGLLLSLVPAALVVSGLASGDGRHSLLQVTAVIGAPLIILSAISASVSLLLSRRAQGGGRDDVDDVALTDAVGGDAIGQLTEGGASPTQTGKTRSSTSVR